MNIETLRQYCLSLPHATEGVQWDNDLLFRIGGKIFAITTLDGTPTKVAFKCTPEKFDELIELEGVIPAPYMARNKWVLIEQPNALSDKEIKSLINISYQLIFAKLPKKIKTTLMTNS